jgi:hypothetical protein
MWDSHKLRIEGFSPIQLFSLGIEELKRLSYHERKELYRVAAFSYRPGTS